MVKGNFLLECVPFLFFYTMVKLIFTVNDEKLCKIIERVVLKIVTCAKKVKDFSHRTCVLHFKRGSTIELGRVF